MEPEQSDADRVFDEFWRPLVMRRDDGCFECSDGYGLVLDQDAVARELYDYWVILQEVPKVYAHITGGRISKPHTTATAVIGEADDATNKACAEAVTEERERLALLIRAATTLDPPLSGSDLGMGAYAAYAAVLAMIEDFDAE